MRIDKPGQYDFSIVGEPAPQAGIEADRKLICAVIQGDEEAQQEFVARYQRVIRAVLNRYIMTPDEREDLYQQVFVHLWEHDCSRISQWQPDGSGRFSSFLCVVVTRLALDHFRKRRLVVQETTSFRTLEEGVEGELPCPAPGPHQMACVSERRRIILQAIQRLSERDQALLKRRYFRQQSYAEIAMALGITIDNVGVALKRAQSRLRKELCREEHAELFPSSTAKPTWGNPVMQTNSGKQTPCNL